MSYKPIVQTGIRMSRYPAGARSVRQPPRINPQTKITGLTAEEMRLYGIAQQSGGAIFQADMVEKSGFSKVKVSRILDRLEGRNLIVRRRRGMTNMVVIRNGDSSA